jgi:hypothetical protein
MAGEAVSKQDCIEDGPADWIIVEARDDDNDQLENNGQQCHRRNEQRTCIVYDAVGASAYALKPDSQRQPGVDVQRDLGEAARRPVNLATGHVVADFEKSRAAP